MSQLKKLIQEVHRRSLWQVLGIYVIGGWLVLQAVDTLAGALNLPEWAPPLALFLLIIGLPIVLATAFVQEGVGRREPAELETTSGGTPIPSSASDGGSGRLLTWRNALIGGLAAFALWGVVATAWLFFGPDVGPRSAESAATAEGADQIRSIAVLPFTTRATKGDEEAVIFSDGMHDDLLTHLSKIGSLKVISRTSVMTYRDNPKPMREIGAELGVETVLEGSVDRVGDRVRVNMQLIDAQTDDHLWGETYDKELTTANLFAIRSDLVKQVAAALQATLTPELEARIAAQPTEDLEAFNLYARGRYFWNKRTREGFETAIEYFRQSIERDSSYAAAYAGIADSYVLLASYSHMPRDEALPLARAAAEQALELDESLAEAHAAMAAVHEMDYETAVAERSYQRAIELNPSYATAHQWYAGLLGITGRAEEALDEIRRAHELDPLSGIISTALTDALRTNRQYLESLVQADRTIELLPDFAPGHGVRVLSLVWLGQLDEALASAHRAAEADLAYGAAPPWVHYYRGEYEVAADQLHRLIELRPGDHFSHSTLARVQTVRGRYDEAIASWERAKELDPDEPFNPLGVAWTYAAVGRADEARAILADMEKLRDDPLWPGALSRMVEVHAALGDHDRAFELLDEAAAVNTQWWALRTDPALDPLREDPRFDALLERVGLDDASVDSIMVRYQAAAE